METALTFDDVLIEPVFSDIRSRSEPDVSTILGSNLDLDLPILSAAMDTVTDSYFARELSYLGGMGVLHRFDDDQKRLAEAEVTHQVGAKFGVAVGLDDCRHFIEDMERVAKPDMYVIDVANGQTEAVADFVEFLSIHTSKLSEICVGNLTSPDAAFRLVSRGADIVKVGIGPGSACTTREKTGCGYPQLSAIQRVSDQFYRGYPTVIADGGIRKPGDMVKALAAGADAVMIGGLFASTDESPEGTEISGLASQKKAEENGKNVYTPEGVVQTLSSRGSLESVIQDLEGGLVSGMSYVGARNLRELQEKARFVRVTTNGQLEGKPRRL